MVRSTFYKGLDDPMESVMMMLIQDISQEVILRSTGEENIFDKKRTIAELCSLPEVSAV